MARPATSVQLELHRTTDSRDARGGATSRVRHRDWWLVSLTGGQKPVRKHSSRSEERSCPCPKRLNHRLCVGRTHVPTPSSSTPATEGSSKKGFLSWLAFELRLLRHDSREWVLLTGDRVLVGILGFLPLVAVLAGVVFSGLAPLQKETPVLFLLFALIGANFTLIAIVTSLSQFVLGRRLESPGEIREKMEDTIDYREEVGRATGEQVVPVQPDLFFLLLYRQARMELDVLAGAQLEARTKHAREELGILLEDLADHCDYVIEVLTSPSSGTKQALFVSLSADYENAVHRVWHLQWGRAEDFTEEAAEPLGRLAGTIQHIEVATRLFKTVFIESEVAELSRYLLYVGLPVQIMAIALTLGYTTAGAAPPLPIGILRVVVPGVIAAGFVPFLLLGTYVIRLTVVANRTADTFPFSSQLSAGMPVRDEAER
jgi:hypothetical protein